MPAQDAVLPVRQRLLREIRHAEQPLRRRFDITASTCSFVCSSSQTRRGEKKSATGIKAGSGFKPNLERRDKVQPYPPPASVVPELKITENVCHACFDTAAARPLVTNREPAECRKYERFNRVCDFLDR